MVLHDAAAEDDAMRCGVMRRSAMRCGVARCGVAREEGVGGLGAALAEGVGFDGPRRMRIGGVAEGVAEAGEQGGVVGEAFEAVAAMQADVEAPAGSRLSETPAGARASCPVWISAPVCARKKNAPGTGRFSFLAPASISRW